MKERQYQEQKFRLQTLGDSCIKPKVSADHMIQNILGPTSNSRSNNYNPVIHIAW